MDRLRKVSTAKDLDNILGDNLLSSSHFDIG